MRKSKQKPGFLYELPGRKAVPFVPIHDKYSDSHLKKPSSTESATATTQVTSDKFIEESSWRNSSVIRAVVDKRLASLQRTHNLQIESLKSEHAETVKQLRKKNQGLRLQISNSKKKLAKTEQSRSRSQTKQKHLIEELANVKKKAAITVVKGKRKLQHVADCVVDANKKVQTAGGGVAISLRYCLTRCNACRRDKADQIQTLQQKRQ